jgi:hypothetical protein
MFDRILRVYLVVLKKFPKKFLVGGILELLFLEISVAIK